MDQRKYVRKKVVYVSRRIKQAHTIRHLRNEKGTGAETRFAIVSGIMPFFLVLSNSPMSLCERFLLVATVASCDCLYTFILGESVFFSLF